MTFTCLISDHPWLQNAKKAPNVSLGETVRARLKQFSVMNKLKKRALKVMFHSLIRETNRSLVLLTLMFKIVCQGQLVLVCAHFANLFWC